MALRLRRGTNAERLTITPELGEPIYTTDTKKIYVGDGSTAGGNPVSIELENETSPSLGGNLDLNGNNIVGTGNINITGTITATGNINLGDGVEDNVIVGGQIGSNLTPTSDSAFNLGSLNKRWGNIYATGLTVDGQLNAENINANLIADDSVVAFNSATGQFNGAFDGELTGSVFADDSTVLVDAINQTITAPGGFIGSLTGELVGSVFSDNSTVLLDGIDQSLSVNLAESEAFVVRRIGEVDAITLQRIGPTTTEMTIGDGFGFDLTANGFQLAAAPTSLQLSLLTEGSNRDPLRLSHHSDVAIENGELRFERSRGTIDTPTAIQNNDRLYGMNWYGYDGTSYNLSTQILSRIQGTVSTGVVPGRLDFRTIDYLGVNQLNLSLQPGPEVHIGGKIFCRGTELNVLSHNDGVDGNYIFALKRSRGSDGSETAVQNGDEIFDIEFFGHDGTNYVETANIITTVDGTVSTGVVPSKFEFQVTDATGNLQNALEISSGRTVTVPGDLSVNGFIDGNFIGSVYADDSSILINAATGSIQVANVDLIGETGNTPGTPGSVDSWLEVTVNGATKYIPLYA